jgi:trehalose 6-phosphate synthase/phosphatase
MPHPIVIDPELERRVAALGRARELAILLDYDGTLVPIVDTPDLARPDEPLMALLSRLASRANTSVHIVSGRPRADLERWFGRLPILLWAEHGIFCRLRDDAWEPTAESDQGWMREIAPILEEAAAKTRGSLVERKEASLAWHYRVADPALAAQAAHDLRIRLKKALNGKPVEMLEGKKVIEVRPRGIGKAVVARYLERVDGDSPVVLALGDDHTDDDLFTALPSSAVTVAVGRGTKARYRVGDYRAARALLRMLI